MKKTKANAVQRNETKVLAAASVASVETLLLVDLWTGQVDDRRGEVQEYGLSEIPPEPQAPVPPSAFAMVNDLLTVDGGQLQDSSEGSLSATFQDTVRAVNAARHLQRLIRGYSRASTAGALHASFTLMYLPHADVAENDASTRHTLSSHAQAGQVMCVGSLCDSIRSIPGLQFTNPPIAPSSDQALTGTLLQLLPPVHMEGYVNEAYEPRVPVEASKPTPVAAELPQARPPAPPGGLQPIVVRSSAGSKISVTMVNPRWVIAGVAAVVVVGTILVFSPWLRNSTHPAVPQTAPAPTSQQAAPLAAGASTSRVSPSPVKAHEAAAIKQKDSAHSRSTAPSVAPDQADVATPRSTQRGMNFSSSEIEALIVRADKDSGNGAYDRAILEYRTVLSYDPSNALAKRGLAKAQYNKSHQ